MYSGFTESGGKNDRKTTTSTNNYATKESTHGTSQSQQAPIHVAAPLNNRNKLQYQLFDESYPLDDHFNQSLTSDDRTRFPLSEAFHRNSISSAGNEATPLDNGYQQLFNEYNRDPVERIDTSSRKNVKQPIANSLANTIKSDMNNFLYPNAQFHSEEYDTGIPSNEPKVSLFLASNIKVFIVSLAFSTF